MQKHESSAQQFALCLNNSDYAVSLQVGKLYPIVPDPEAEAHGYLRVIDEGGEDYGYAADRFYVMGLPLNVEQTLRAAV